MGGKNKTGLTFWRHLEWYQPETAHEDCQYAEPVHEGRDQHHSSTAFRFQPVICSSVLIRYSITFGRG